MNKQLETISFETMAIVEYTGSVRQGVKSIEYSFSLRLMEPENRNKFIENIVNRFVEIEEVTRPLKAVSQYRIEELKDMMKRLDISYPLKMKKVDLYGLLEKFLIPAGGVCETVV